MAKTCLWSVRSAQSRQCRLLRTKDSTTPLSLPVFSASRKTVRPVMEKYDHLLIYPMAYEGLEQSPNIIYTGAAPNQQITPAVKWSLDNLGRRFFRYLEIR